VFLYVDLSSEKAVVGNRTLRCAHHVRVSINEFLGKEAKFGGFRVRQGLPFVTLCQDSYMLIGPLSDGAAGVSDNMERLIKQCLGMLDY